MTDSAATEPAVALDDLTLAEGTLALRMVSALRVLVSVGVKDDVTVRDILDVAKALDELPAEPALVGELQREVEGLKCVRDTYSAEITRLDHKLNGARTAFANFDVATRGDGPEYLALKESLR